VNLGGRRLRQLGIPRLPRYEKIRNGFETTHMSRGIGPGLASFGHLGGIGLD